MTFWGSLLRGKTEMVTQCVSFLGLSLQMTASLAAENHRNLFSRDSGGQKSKIKALAGSVPSGGSEGESVLHPVFVPCGCQQPPVLLGLGSHGFKRHSSCMCCLLSVSLFSLFCSF